MLLRRMMGHVKHQNWLAVFLDFVIVVAGILIAFQITQWNENRRERERETYVLERLTEDVRSIQSQAHAYTRDYQRRADAAGRILQTALSDEPLPDEQPLLLEDLNQVFIRLTPIQRSPTFVELISSGELGVIQNNTLRESLIQFDLNIQSALQSDGIQVEFWIRNGAPLFAHTILDDQLGVDWQHSAYRVGSFDFSALRSDDTQISALSWIRRMHMFAANFSSDIATRADALAELLERYQEEQQP